MASSRPGRGISSKNHWMKRSRSARTGMGRPFLSFFEEGRPRGRRLGVSIGLIGFLRYSHGLCAVLSRSLPDCVVNAPSPYFIDKVKSQRNLLYPCVAQRFTNALNRCPIEEFGGL